MAFPKRKAKSMLWVLAVVAITTLFIFSHIDDWSRDLTTNVAATDANSGDLRPLTLAIPPDQALQRLRRVVQNLPRWHEHASSTDQSAPADSIHIHLVRTTALLRFKDDVHVRLVAAEDGQSTTVHVHSQSRIGRGDLGQNPRNIRELLSELRTSESFEPKPQPQ